MRLWKYRHSKPKSGASSGQSAASEPTLGSHTIDNPSLQAATAGSRKPRHLESENAATNFFPGATNVIINGGTMSATVNVKQGHYEHLRHLDTHVAPNAILNAGGRADIPSCFPGTREAVISEAEDWIARGHRTDRRIFWLSGPAGAGKSAVIQTVAERCIHRGTPMANFFFFRADGSRNHSAPVIPTLLHQLLKVISDLKILVNDLIAEDSLVFKASIRDQFRILLDGPVRDHRRGVSNPPPVVILIDGLDECDPRAGLDTSAKTEQRALLRALHDLVTSPDSPFIALAASRVESHIEMFFKSFGCTDHSIFLDKDYHPDNDIRLYVTAELSRIRDTHPLGARLGAQWPSAVTIEAIVQRSSGQFIFAATVCRFIENSPESPAFVMDMVMKHRPTDNHSPFTEIDAIYLLILARCKHSTHVCDIIAQHSPRGYAVPYSGKESGDALIGFRELGYTEDEVLSFFADVTSIMKTEIGATLRICFYHASFLDFINSPERAGTFYADRIGSANRLAPRVIASYHFWQYGDARNVTYTVTQRSEPLQLALKALLRDLDLLHNGVHHWDYVRSMVERLFTGHDDELCRQVRNIAQSGDEEY